MNPSEAQRINAALKERSIPYKLNPILMKAMVAVVRQAYLDGFYEGRSHGDDTSSESKDAP